MKLSQHEIYDLIERLQKGENLPEDYKYKLFPVMQKEYELVYGGKMRREDVLANEDGVFPVPLQIEKTYNGKREQWKDGWKNIIAFGDNLQFLKTIYENKDPLIKDRVKGKVKLIYIDPPFGTGDEYDGKDGQKGYSAKTKGADFVEFIRRRVIVAKEILANDGNFLIRLDYHFGDYVKVLLDEIFGKNNFINEFTVNRISKKGFANRSTFKAAKYPQASDKVFWYVKSNEYFFEIVKTPKESTKEKWHSMDTMDVNPMPRPRVILGKTLIAPQGRKWMFKQEKIDEMEKLGLIRFNTKGVPQYKVRNQDFELLDTNWSDIPGYSFKTGYPTENSEQLLDRIIRSFSKEEDLIMDFFGGSGTTVAVAEQLNRKWITCDIGKLSFYTIQKRLLNIEFTKSIENQKSRYGKSTKSFITLNTGHYDLAKIFDLKQKEYSEFVMNLFEVEPKKKTISGIQIDGEKKDGYNVIVWQYWKFKNSSVDEDFLHNLHSNMGTKAGKRIYIIAPASYVDFISDYYEIDKVRYYFLKVPYQIIRELHKVQFKKFRQPQSKSNVNDLEDAIGFHFIRQPEVKSEVKEKSGEYHITISKFHSDFSEEETDKEMANFESLAMVLIDKDFLGETFDMDMYYFAEDLLPKKKKKVDEVESVENIKEALKSLNQITFPPIPSKECGKRLMLIYVDIYGNEFKEEFKLK